MIRSLIALADVVVAIFHENVPEDTMLALLYASAVALGLSLLKGEK